MRKWCNEKSANFLNVKKTLNSSVKYITSKKIGSDISLDKNGHEKTLNERQTTAGDGQ